MPAPRDNAQPKRVKAHCLRVRPFQAGAPAKPGRSRGFFHRGGVIDINQQTNAPQPGGARDLLFKLYREIGISAVAAALEYTRRPKDKPIEPSQNPAVLREEKAA